MKKLIINTLFLFTALLLTAQTEKGNFLLSATTNLNGLNQMSMLQGAANSAGFSITTYQYKSDDFESDKEKATSLNLNLKAGYFVADNLMIGASFGNFSYIPDEGNSTTLIQFGPLFRYYYPMKRIQPFVFAEGGSGTIGIGSQGSVGLLAFQGGLGTSFFISSQVSIDLVVGYAYSRQKDNEDNDRETYQSFGFGFGLSVFLGGEQ